MEHTALGSGFKIAMEDLKIRGAGNLLGVEQSGHISAVGFDFYCRLLREAVVNYVTNAIKYTPEGGRVGIGARLKDGSLVIEVSDTGLGIPPDRLSNVFKDFGRVQSELPDGTKPEGTGLGLSITKRVVEAHGGLVGVESVVGVGSRFRIVLPLGKVADTE